jgi:formyl-CoA transferase
MTDKTIRPMAGLKVVELGTLIAGPFASRILAEFGADVVKVESPDGGDPLRKWRLLYEGTSLWWFVQARNKKSVTLNLKHPRCMEVLRRLLADADVLVENFRPGVLDKLGLTEPALRELNPSLIVVRLSGFGQTGPMAQQPGFGAIGESMGGLRYITGFAGSAAGQGRDIHRRFDRCAVGGDRRPHGLASSRCHRRTRGRSGADRRCGSV